MFENTHIPPVQLQNTGQFVLTYQTINKVMNVFVKQPRINIKIVRGIRIHSVSQ